VADPNIARFFGCWVFGRRWIYVEVFQQAGSDFCLGRPGGDPWPAPGLSAAFSDLPINPFGAALADAIWRWDLFGALEVSLFPHGLLCGGRRGAMVLGAVMLVEKPGAGDCGFKWSDAIRALGGAARFFERSRFFLLTIAAGGHGAQSGDGAGTG